MSAKHIAALAACVEGMRGRIDVARAITLAGVERQITPRAVLEASFEEGWTRQADASFFPREGSAKASFDNKIWVLGGTFREPSAGNRRVWTNAAWRSSDGETWSNVTGTYGANQDAAACVHSGRLYYSGGRRYSGGFDSSVWRSVYYTTDGATWTRVADIPVEPGGEGRYAHGMLSFGGLLWLLPGSDDRTQHRADKIYSSADGGTTWIEGVEFAASGGTFRT